MITSCRKAITNLDSVLKSKDITLPTKVHINKPMVFPVMYGFESCTIKKAKCRRIDAFELWDVHCKNEKFFLTRVDNDSIMNNLP